MVMKQKRTDHTDAIQKYRSKMDELDKQEEQQAKISGKQKVSDDYSIKFSSSFHGSLICMAFL